MDFDTLTSLEKPRLRVKVSRREKTGEPFAQNVLNGLSANPKVLSPRFFYDKIGSELFEQICALPEYYPTRTERSILKQYALQIAAFGCENTTVVELGSGSSSKTKHILEAFLKLYENLHYMPVDISKTMLVQAAKILRKKYPGLHITGLASDYHAALSYIKNKNLTRKLILFLGSSIGNFSQSESEAFLLEIRNAMQSNDMLLIGMDLVKPLRVLLPAYNDADGVTAEFNLNILRRINREFDGEFDLSKFRHDAIFNQSESRIEMHLISTTDQNVKVDALGKTFSFRKNETIHTENSYKYSEEKIEKMAGRADLKIVHSWYDKNKWFSLNLMKPV